MGKRIHTARKKASRSRRGSEKIPTRKKKKSAEALNPKVTSYDGQSNQRTTPKTVRRQSKRGGN